jgi:hypothetical protein
MVLTVSFALSPVTGLVCHRRLAKFISQSLTPASGRQDHTTSPSASVLFVRSTSASTASRTNVRDDRETPLSGTGRGAYVADLRVVRSEIFFEAGMDRILPDGQIA